MNASWKALINRRTCHKYAAVSFIFPAITATIAVTAVLGYEVDTEQLVLRFENGYLTSQPVITDGCIEVTTSEGATILNELPGVIEMKYYPNRSMAPMRLEGPYLVTVLTSRDPLTKLQDLTANEFVSYAYEELDGALPIGEHVAAWFPESSQVRFCDTQWQLHRRLDNEAQYDEEWCDLAELENDDNDMDLVQAWGITTGNEEVVVAMLDVGFDWAHPELGGDGPESECSFQDSLFSYRSGVIYTNSIEEVDDGNQDGRPGIAYVDDDLDGLIDEDSESRDYRNDMEIDVCWGVSTDLDGLTLYDVNAEWNVNELVGRWLYFIHGNPLSLRAQIISNTVISITTTAIPLGGEQYLYSFEPYTYVGDNYRVGDGESNNESWPDNEIDDRGWLGDLAADDDENGFNDDIHGYDFTNQLPGGGRVPCPNEDYLFTDNDIFSNCSHGTATASMVGTSELYGTMMGVAPNIKILPVRTGYGFFVNNECEHGVYPYRSLSDGIEYAMTFNPDVIVTAVDSYDLAALEVAQEAADSGIIIVNGAGNTAGDNPHSLTQVEPSVLVSGVGETDVRWSGTSYGEWVDVSARSYNLYVAKTFKNGVHQYGIGWSGTSLAGPIVGGVAALVKSAYPDMDRDDIIWMVKRGVDYIDVRNPGYEGLLGTGRVNAYRALTMYGDCPAMATDTTWTGTVYVSGDVVVPAGKTLHINSGTEILIANGDILSSGTYANQVEFIVDGRISCSGTSVAGVDFRCYAENGTWGPIRFENNSVEESQFGYTTFRNCSTALEKTSLAYRAGVVVEHCAFYNVDRGIRFVGMALGDYLTVSNSVFTGSSNGTRAIEALAYGGDYDHEINIHNNVDIDGFGCGIIAEGGQGLSVYGVNIANCDVGMIVIGGPTTTVIGPSIYISDSSNVGLFVADGSHILQGIEVDNSAIGISISDVTSLTTGGAQITLTNNNTHGFVASGLDGDTISAVTVIGAGDDGMRLIDCTNMSITGVDIVDVSGSGVYIDDGDCELTASTIQDCNIGAQSVNTGYIRIRNVAYEYCNNGFVCGVTGRANVGEVGDYGNNTFLSRRYQYYGANLNMSEALDFVGNCYDGGTNPSPTKFVTVNAVIYTPAYCE